MKVQSILFISFVSLSFGCLQAQNVIKLKNSSFEADMPGAGIPITDWINLGSEFETPPDIQPGFFQVNIGPQEGRKYLGLVVRSSNTWEGVGQQLKSSLQKDSAYSFSLWMTRSIVYRSPLKNYQSEVVNFDAPTILKIWGYNTKTKQEELLAESQPVSHSEWTKYEFVLQPGLADYDELDLMAYYAPGAEQKNGNLLIDNCSAIVKISK